MKQNVLIVGAGALGKSLAGVLATRPSLGVALWDRDPSKVQGQPPLDSSASGADVVLICTPADGVRGVLASLAPHLKPTTVAIAFAKGLEQSSGSTAFEVLDEVLGNRALTGVVGGPLLAGELAEGRGGVAVVASRREESLVAVASLFEGTQLDVLRSSDPASISAVGVLKNVYAVALGVCDYLEWGLNAKGWFVVQSLNEMETLLTAMGLNQDVVRDTAGLGDLVATIFSTASRNRAAGYELAQSGTTSKPSEGLRSVALLVARAGAAAEILPILTALRSVVANVSTPFEAFSNLRPTLARAEH